MPRERRTARYLPFTKYVANPTMDSWVIAAAEKAGVPHIAPKPFPVHTDNGEIVNLVLSKETCSDWNGADLTYDCRKCPFFIPEESLEPVVATIRPNIGKRKQALLSRMEGVCAFGRNDEGSSSYKILLKGTERFFPGCSFTPEQRQARYESKKKRGEII